MTRLRIVFGRGGSYGYLVANEDQIALRVLGGEAVELLGEPVACCPCGELWLSSKRYQLTRQEAADRNRVCEKLCRVSEFENIGVLVELACRMLSQP